MPSERQLITEAYLTGVRKIEKPLKETSFEGVPDEDLKQGLLEIMTAVTGAEDKPEMVERWKEQIATYPTEKLQELTRNFLAIGNAQITGSVQQDTKPLPESGETLAREFHEIYEQKAPDFGYACSEWVEELEAELRRAQERTKHEADFAHYREASYWAGVRDTYERIIASWRNRFSTDANKTLQREFAFGPPGRQMWENDGEIADAIQEGVARIAGLADRTRITRASGPLEQLYFEVTHTADKLKS